MMGNVSEDGRESAQGAPEATPEQIAAIHAAMMVRHIALPFSNLYTCIFLNVAVI